MGLARAARAAGMRHAVLEVYGFDAAVYGRATRRPDAYARFVDGVEALASVGMHRTARVVVADETVDALSDTLQRLTEMGVTVDEAVVVGAAHEAATRAALTRVGASPTVRVTDSGL